MVADFARASERTIGVGGVTRGRRRRLLGQLKVVTKSWARRDERGKGCCCSSEHKYAILYKRENDIVVCLMNKTLKQKAIV